MKNSNGYVALFDLDGVVMDTESQYTIFWDGQGMKHLQIPHFCSRIKGQTLTQIFDAYYPDDGSVREQITRELNDFEQNMSFDYIAGADTFIRDLRRCGFQTALVTSSNDAKMNNVYRAHPDFREMFDAIVTADMIVHSKPDPECFLAGMKMLGADALHTVVLEDSFHGLDAGKASGAYVVGLATTNPRQTIENRADSILDDFTNVDAAWLIDKIKNRI